MPRSPPAGRPGRWPGVPFAVKNLFDVAGLPTRAGSKINRDRPPAAARRACWSRRMTRGRRRAGRRAQHGRVRLRLHRRERPRRRLPQPARSRPDERRLLVGLRRRHRRRARAGLARLRHQRLDPRAGLALRRLRPEADLRPARPRPAPSPSSTASTISGRSPAPRADLALAYDALQGPDPADHACAARPAEPALPELAARRRRAARSASLGGWFRDERRRRGAAPRSPRAAEALGDAAELGTVALDARRGRPRRRLPHHQRRERRLPPRAAAAPRRRLRSRHPRPLPRRRAAAGRLGRPGAAGPALVARAGARRLPRRRPAARAGHALPRAGDRRRRPSTSAAASLPLRPNLGLLAQPFSCIGLPVATVPVFAPGAMPIGVQLVAPPGARISACGRRTSRSKPAAVAAAHPSHYPVLAMPRYMPDHPAGPGQVPWLG